MPKLTINDVELEVANGITVLQACEQAGHEIPRFCYHDRLSIAGNCRMCLVEVSPGPPKPQASCALPVNEGMKIKTDSAMVQAARKGVMEFLLINHPLDCPICDQGGECDLQDQAMGYGSDSSRYAENKRAVLDKYMGPLIKTVMTRCIHCTRCVRFSTEIAGVEEMGLLNRGEHAEISTLEQAVSSELSGNLIDLCPVGALTSKPYAFKARSWEMKKHNGIDVSDAMGSNIRIDVRGNEVMRILPRLHEEVNQEWICDKARFSYDGLKANRLDRPYIRNRQGVLEEASWDKALQVSADAIKQSGGSGFAAIAGDLCDLESMYGLKHLAQSMKSPNYDCRQDGALFSHGQRGDYLFNTGISNIEKADAILLVGANPRSEAPLINAHLRQCYLQGALIGLIGEAVDLRYPYQHLGDTPDNLASLLNGRSQFCKEFIDAKNPMIIVGAGALARADGAQIWQLARQFADKYQLIRDDWNGFNILHHAASRVGGLDIGMVPEIGGFASNDIAVNAVKQNISTVYLLGADNVKLEAYNNCFVIYQGHHGDKGATHADVILPGSTYTEKSGIYVNLEGRVQVSDQAALPPGDAREDWKIIRALSDRLHLSQPWKDLDELREHLFSNHPHLAREDYIEREPISKADKHEKLIDKKFTLPIDNFYLSNVIARASKTMNHCVNEILATDDMPSETDRKAS